MTMTHTLRSGVLVLAVATVASPAFAQDRLVLTVDAAVARGLTEAPRLAEARAREAAADATVAARAALGKPVLTASSGLLRTNHVDEFGIPQSNGSLRIIFPDIPTNYRARAEVTMPIYTSGRVGELVASAEANRRAVDADRRATSADIALGVAQAYWALVMSRERVGVLERSLERADASLETVRARVEAGVLPPNDALSAEAQRARQLVQLIQARNDASLAEAELGRLVGAAPGQAIATVTPVDQPTPGAAELVAQSAEILAARAAESRPERQALTERQASFRAAADAAYSAARPQVGVLAAVEPARPNARFVPRVDKWNTGWDVGVNVTWAIWDGGRARAERAGAIAEADALRSRAAEFDAVVRVEVRQRVLDIESGRAALTASAVAVNAAQEARRVLAERFAAGVATNTDVLDADVAWLEAELERTRLQAALRVSEARLLRTVGHP